MRGQPIQPNEIFYPKIKKIRIFEGNIPNLEVADQGQKILTRTNQYAKCIQ